MNPAGRWLRIPSRLAPFFTARFIKFAAVGASGVGVNLGALWAFSAGLGLRSSVASALAIQVSIFSNFLVNELWTFRDLRHDAGSVLGRGLRFQAVSLVGALIQWTVFLAGNVGGLWLLDGDAALTAYFAGGEGVFETYLRRPVVDPPEVGAWIYVSQLLGIAAATGWNFFANLNWTWKARGTKRG